MANTEKIYYNEKSLVPGKIYMKEVSLVWPQVKVPTVEKTLLGEFVEFYVEHRNGCSMYDEPYFIFKKDGQIHREATLDLQYYKAKVYEVPAEPVVSAEPVVEKVEPEPSQ